MDELRKAFDQLAQRQSSKARSNPAMDVETTQKHGAVASKSDDADIPKWMWNDRVFRRKLRNVKPGY